MACAELARWDDCLGDVTFGHSSFDHMRDSFITGFDQLAHTIVAMMANRIGTNRNDSCFCGSGRKFKKCCMRKGLYELARDW